MNNVDGVEFILACGGTEALVSPSGDPVPESLEKLEQILMLGLGKRLCLIILFILLILDTDYIELKMDLLCLCYRFRCLFLRV